MKAVIMAGGFGTRLRPLTCRVPKPMVPVANKPMMHHIVELLKFHGIENLIVALYYQPESIINYFGNGKAFGVNIEYKKAEADYGTAGSVKNAKDLLNERFLVISGDVLTDFDLGSAINFHLDKKAKVTMLLTRVNNPLQYGIVLTDENGLVTRFLEKPSWGEVFSDTINTGIYIIEPEILDYIPDKQEFDFSKSLFPILLKQKAGLYGYIANGYWKDIGNLNDYQDAHLDIIQGKAKIKIEGTRNGNLIIGDGSIIEDDQRNFTGTNVIGKNCRIHKGSRISNSVLGDNCEILPGAVIRNTIIWQNSKIGSRSELSFDVVCSNCNIDDDVVVLENVFISDSCTIGKHSTLLSNIKIWPDKNIEAGSTVTRSLVWEERWIRELFTDARITGLSNIEINPEFGAKLGAAFGAFVGAGSSIVASRDSDNVSRMISRAIMSGLMSAGVNCIDLRATSIPIVRHELRTGKEQGGIHVRKSPFDRNSTDIIFFDVHGKDLPSSKTKAIERLFFAEDFPRASFDKVGSISFPERATESYIQRFIETIDINAIKSAKLKVVIDYSNGIASTIFPNIIGDLNIQIISLNAYLDSNRLTRTKEEFEESLRHLSYVVTSLKYDIGCMLDAGAEKIFVIDENGNIISNDRLLTIFTKLLILSGYDMSKFAVPITATSEVQMLAKEYGLELIKTRDSHLALMEAASDKQIKFVGGTKGGFIFKEFLFASDGMYSIVKLLECMAKTKKRIGEIDRETKKLHFAKKNVPCPWHLKGKILRRLTEESGKIPHDLIEGIRLYPQGTDSYTSVMLIPDRSRPIFHINAESAEPAIAENLCAEYENKVRRWIETEK